MTFKEVAKKIQQLIVDSGLPLSVAIAEQLQDSKIQALVVSSPSFTASGNFVYTKTDEAQLP